MLMRVQVRFDPAEPFVHLVETSNVLLMMSVDQIPERYEVHGSPLDTGWQIAGFEEKPQDASHGTSRRADSTIAFTCSSLKPPAGVALIKPTSWPTAAVRLARVP